MNFFRTSHAVPATRVTAEQIAEWTGAAPDFIANKIGIPERGFLGPDESVTDLAVRACRNLADEHGLDLTRVELLILVTQNPDNRLPHTSAILQHVLGLDQATACFDLNLGCSGFVYGLSVARGLMAAEGFRNALLVTCDPYSKIMRREDKNTVAVFGDAATATWLSADSGAVIGRGDFGTDGQGAKSLMVAAGGSATPCGGIWNDDLAPHSREACGLFMDGRGIYNFMMRRVPLTMAACLQKNNLRQEDVDLFVFHQASRFLLESLTARLKLPPDKVPIVLDGFGNTVSSTIPIVLGELYRRQALAGKIVMVCGFGVGLSWATNILRFSDDG